MGIGRGLTGHMARPIAAQTYPPRRIVQNRGSKADRLVPAETELAAIFVPSWASANPAAITKIPNRSAELASSRNISIRIRGFQTDLPKITLDDEVTTMPINEVTANPTGIVMTCDHTASLGWRE